MAWGSTLLVHGGSGGGGEDHPGVTPPEARGGARGTLGNALLAAGTSRATSCDRKWGYGASWEGNRKRAWR